MTKKGRVIRIVVNSFLLVAIIALGVTVYQAGTEGKKAQQEQSLVEQSQKQAQGNREDTEEEEPMVDVGTSQVEAQLEAEEQEIAEVSQEEATGEAAEEAAVVPMEEETVAALPQVNFTEDSLMIWPLQGDILLDYNMEETIYHPTLDVYKYSPAIAISSAVDAPVVAAASGTVTAIEENEETGTTVTVDMGNGYQAVYGQLKDLNVALDQTIGESTIIGYVAEPTKYYSQEGSNLYFAMKKDGVPADPLQYLP